MKWWITDYDGTISHNHEGEWEKEDHEFIKEWREENKFIVASGRVLPELMEIFEKYDVVPSYYICNNGGYVYNNKGENLFKKNINLDIREKLFAELKKQKDKFSIGYCIGDKRKWYSQGFKLDKWVRGPLSQEAEQDLLYHEDVNVIYLICDPNDVDFAKTTIQGLNGLKAVSTGPGCVEIFDESISKALGIEHLQNIEGFTWEDCITTGDGENDLEMLAAAKHSFAIDLASEVVENAAKIKIKRVREFKNYLD